LDEAVALLDAGAILAIPTDTVYGFAARIDRPPAVRRLFRVKDRPEGVALPILVAGLDQARRFLGPVDPTAEALGERFWPGPLTVVAPCAHEIATLVGSQDGTAGVRMPNDDLALRLLARSGPLAVSSANLHGEPPCTTAQAVVTLLGSSIDVSAVIDGGLCDGVPSTVVRVEGSAVVLLRSGPLGIEDLIEPSG
jgi:tRNA threonylcarbamoyl adenosine modification protein (Sua5/YciO/YrdC/YwlC family)